MDYQYTYKSAGMFKAELGRCAEGAVRVIDDSKLPGGKRYGAGRRILWTARDSEGREGVVLCRSDTKNRRLRQVYGQTLEEVLAYERVQFPR